MISWIPTSRACLAHHPDHGFAAYRPDFIPIRSATRFHPPGFLDWLFQSPELQGKNIDVDLHWFQNSGEWKYLEGKLKGSSIDPSKLDIKTYSDRRGIFVENDTNAYRVMHKLEDKIQPYSLDKLGDRLLYSSSGQLNKISDRELQFLKREMTLYGCKSCYFQSWSKNVRGVDTQSLDPQLILGDSSDTQFTTTENGVGYLMKLDQGYSTGLFLDHRDNRLRLLHKSIQTGWELPAKGELLNTFAYTCGFSVVSALSGWKTVSLDLSKKYLDWGRENFSLNQLDAHDHDFIYGDVFDWLNRFANKERLFDCIILDPPTFSKSKKGKKSVFRAEKDFATLSELAGRILRKGGHLLASTNARNMSPDKFLNDLSTGLSRSGHQIVRSTFAGQGPDFPISPKNIPHLKSFWIQCG